MGLNSASVGANGNGTKPGPQTCGGCASGKGCFFGGLPAPVLNEVRARRATSVVRRRKAVFTEGSMPSGVWVVCRGRVKLHKSDAKGHQLAVGMAGPGELIGHGSLLSRVPHSTTAEALEETVVSFIEDTAFRSLLASQPGLVQRLMATLATGVRQAEDQARDLAWSGSRERLAALLVRLEKAHGRTDPDGTVIDVPLVRADLAEMAGLAHETAIRIISQLQEDKVVVGEGHRLRVLNDAALHKEAGLQN